MDYELLHIGLVLTGTGCFFSWTLFKIRPAESNAKILAVLSTPLIFMGIQTVLITFFSYLGVGEQSRLIAALSLLPVGICSAGFCLLVFKMLNSFYSDQNHELNKQ